MSKLHCFDRRKLNDALIYNRWLDLENFADSTRPVMVHSLSWISRHYLPSQLRERARQRLRGYRMMPDADGELVNEVYLIARECYKALAAKLGDKPYFLGDHPTSLDAVAFGYLSMHCIPSFKNPRLFSLLTFEFPTLIAYCDRLNRQLFAVPPRTSPNVRPPNLLLHFARNPRSYFVHAYQSAQTWLDRVGGNAPSSLESSSTTATEGDEKSAADKTYSDKQELVRASRRDAFYKTMSVVTALGMFVGYILYHGIIEVVEVEEDGEEGGVELA
ncbi:hypothetical protein BC829DRAFT_448769 [Chytridium lagenaria]|nr:hypothetical protein BC829DRAFT_448769 [Chytridium lagenaria]